VIIPLAAPNVVGVNVAFRFAVCPGATVVLPPMPVEVNPAPLTDTLDIVTLALPTLVNVTTSESLLPSNTSPKLRFATLGFRSVVDVTALAVAVIVSGELGALLISETAPLAWPAELAA
jgi:hypothetical protein